MGHSERASDNGKVKVIGFHQNMPTEADGRLGKREVDAVLTAESLLAPIVFYERERRKDNTLNGK